MWNTFEEMLEQHADAALELQPAFDAMPPLTEEWRHLVTAFLVCRQAAEEELAGQNQDERYITAAACRAINDHIPTDAAVRLLATLPPELNDLESWTKLADVDDVFRATLVLSAVAREVSRHMFRTSIDAPPAEA